MRSLPTQANDEVETENKTASAQVFARNPASVYMGTSTGEPSEGFLHEFLCVDRNTDSMGDDQPVKIHESTFSSDCRASFLFAKASRMSRGTPPFGKH